MNVPTLISSALLVTLGACTGAPVVGRSFDAGEPECDQVPVCGTLDPGLSLDPLDADTFTAFETCPPGSPGAPCDDLRERACEEQQAQCDRFTRGAAPTGGVLAGCAPEGRVRIEGHVILDTLDVSCSELALDLAPNAELVFRGGSIMGTRFDVVGGPGSKLRFEEVVGERVHISLAEDAWLEVQDGSQFSQLTVVADAAMAGRIAAIRASSLRDLRASAGPRAEVLVEESAVETGAFDVGQLVLAGSDLRRVHARATNLVAGQGSLEGDVLEIGTGYIDGVSVADSEVRRCGSLTVVGASLRRSAFAVCDTPLVVRQGAVFQSALRGSTLLTGAIVEESLFETGAGGTNTFEDTQTSRSRFCETPSLVATGSRFSCVSCHPRIGFVTLQEGVTETDTCPGL